MVDRILSIDKILRLKYLYPEAIGLPVNLESVPNWHARING